MHSYVELLEYSFLDYPSIPKKQPKDFDLQEGTASKRAVTRLREKSVAETGWKQDVSNSQQSHGWRFWLVPAGAKDLSASLVREAYRVTGVKQNPGEIKGDPSVNGRIHSIESFGTVDGPGIRCVVFLQGCSLRCRYCHNPDTWDRQGGQEIDAEEVVQKVLRFKSYFGEKGGITLSGGEPLLQPDFVADILKKCKQEGIHTAVDTSGCVDIDALEKVLPYTDLLLLDIKGLNEEDYAWITGQRIEKYREALQVIQKWKTNLWLRYVVLPGINDSQRHRERLKEFVGNLSSQVQNFELLPYHPLGVHKWERLGLKYTLSDLQTPNQAEMDQSTQEIGKFLRK